VPPNLKRRIRGLVLDSDGRARRFSSKVAKREATYALLTTLAFAEPLLLHISNFVDDWQKLAVGSELEISIGFAMTGAQASEARFRNVNGTANIVSLGTVGMKCNSSA